MCGMIRFHAGGHCRPPTFVFIWTEEGADREAGVRLQLRKMLLAGESDAAFPITDHLYRHVQVCRKMLERHLATASPRLQAAPEASAQLTSLRSGLGHAAWRWVLECPLWTSSHRNVKARLAAIGTRLFLCGASPLPGKVWRDCPTGRHSATKPGDDNPRKLVSCRQPDPAVGRSAGGGSSGRGSADVRGGCSVVRP